MGSKYLYTRPWRNSDLRIHTDAVNSWYDTERLENASMKMLVTETCEFEIAVIT